MNDKRQQLLSLFEGLTDDQQNDLLNIMKTWNDMSPRPNLTKELHCLNALKKVVEDHFPPHVELGFIAFHPDLDCISTAKTKEAAIKMYLLEASYDLMNIFEKDPDSELFDKDIIQTLQHYLHDVPQK